jgi:hypothetical protein
LEKDANRLQAYKGELVNGVNQGEAITFSLYKI